MWSNETVGRDSASSRIWAQKSSGAKDQRRKRNHSIAENAFVAEGNGTENNDVNTQSQTQGGLALGFLVMQSFSLLMKAHRALS